MNLQVVMSSREEDSLVQSLHALRQFEAERETRVDAPPTPAAADADFDAEQERWVEEIQRLAHEEAESMQAERRRYDAEALATSLRSLQEPAPSSQRPGLSTLLALTLIGVAGTAYFLEHAENLRRTRASITASAAADEREQAVRADVERLQAQLAALESGRGGPAAIAPGAVAAPVVQPMAPTPAPPGEVVEKSADPPGKPHATGTGHAKQPRQHGRAHRAASNREPKRQAVRERRRGSGKMALDFKPCPPGKPLCR